jgi:hypothetical protein
MSDHGPYGTERAAHAAAVAAIPPKGGRVILSAAQNRQLLRFATEGAGVTTGAWDDRILDWISGYEDSTCAVLAGLIARAYEAGKAVALDGAVTEWALAYTHTPNPASGLPPRREVQSYPDEESARAAVAAVRAEAPEDEPRLMCHEVTPWREVPDA